MVSFAILGCGRIGQVHASSLAQINNAKLVAVVDAVPEAANNLSAQCNVPVSDVATVMADKSIDAIVIATPTDTHFELIHQAANAGKAIFCEKPVDISTQRIRACIEVVEKANVPFLAAFNRRFDPHFANVQQQIQAGVIGDVEQVIITSRDPAPPPIGYIKSSGGIFRDMMIHDLDMARFLLGEEPTELMAFGSCLFDKDIGAAGDHDTASATLKTARGVICQISVSRRASYGYDQRIEVHGSKGMLRAENVLQNHVELATKDGFLRPTALHFFLERYKLAYLLELKHFIEAIETGAQISPNIHDGLRAQILADAATESAQTQLLKTLN